MKKNRTLLTVLALALVLGMTACKHDDGDEGISGSTIVSDATVEELPAALQGKETDFSYFGNGEPISNYINPPASVKVSSSGKISINLGVPKDAYLTNLSAFDWTIPGVTVSSPGVKTLTGDIETDEFYTYDRSYKLRCMNNASRTAGLMYVSDDVTITGSDRYKVNLPLKKGWNYVFDTTASTTLPAGYKWVVITNMFVDGAIQGTWKGNDENGTLVITGGNITSPDTEDTKAKSIASALSPWILAIAGGSAVQTGAEFSLTISDGKFTLKLIAAGESFEEVLYTYTIIGSTLTITGPHDNSVAFTGNKQ
jgi:hypothetical protein